MSCLGLFYDACVCSNTCCSNTSFDSHESVVRDEFPWSLFNWKESRVPRQQNKIRANSCKTRSQAHVGKSMLKWNTRRELVQLVR